MDVNTYIDKCIHCHKNSPTKIVRMYRSDGGYDELRCLCDECYNLLMNAFPTDPTYEIIIKSQKSPTP